MVLGADRQKLSKRNGDSSVHEYLEQGYLYEALLNFLALLGWSPGSELKTENGHPEIFSMKELVNLFSLDGLQKAPAVFDVQKLRWMNGMYMRALPLEEIVRRGRPFFEKAGLGHVITQKGDAWFSGIVDVIRGESTLLSDLPAAAKLFFEARPDVEDAAKAVLQDAAHGAVITALEAEIAALGEHITPEQVDAFQKSVGAKTGAKGKGLFMPIRAAITGKTHGPELKKVLPLLGKKAVMDLMSAVKAQI